jgi:hypothetical protein
MAFNEGTLAPLTQLASLACTNTSTTPLKFSKIMTNTSPFALRLSKCRTEGCAGLDKLSPNGVGLNNLHISHDQLVVNVVEKAFDVQVQHPVLAPAALDAPNGLAGTPSVASQK